MIRFCENCGNLIEPNSSFCSNCGARINEGTPQSTPVQSFQERISPVQHNTPIQQPETTNPKKKHTLAVVVTILIIMILAAATFVVLFIAPGILRTPNTPPATMDDIKKPVTEPSTPKPSENTTEPDNATNPEIAPDPNAIIEGFGNLFNKPEQEKPSNAPDFEKYSIVPTLNIGEVFDYTTSCYKDESFSTTGYMQITSYTRGVVTDEMIDFGHENSMELAGYDVLKLEISGTFSDDNALEYGVQPVIRTENYYDVKRFDDSAIENVDSYDETYKRYEIDYNGGPAYIYSWTNGGWESSENTGALNYNIQWTFLVPSGFDGLVCGFQNATSFVPDSYIYDNYDSDQYRLFRLS